MDLSVGQIILLVAAGFVAGALNMSVGGGSLISFPALVAAGLPSVSANVTNTVALLPGYVGGAVGYRSELQGQRGRAQALGLTTAAGGLVGAILIVVSDPKVFEAIVPFLILFSCALLAAQPLMSSQARAPMTGSKGLRSPRLHVPAFAVAIYGGYFGAGLGFLLLAVLSLAIDDSTQRLNALRGILAFVINATAAVVFLLFAPVAWAAALITAVTTYGGGHLGAGLARRLSDAALRAVVVVFGVPVAILLMID